MRGTNRSALLDLPLDQLVAVLNSGQPWLPAAVGVGGLAVITWLLMFKPLQIGRCAS
jgi:hypothetical protein